MSRAAHTAHSPPPGWLGAQPQLLTHRQSITVTREQLAGRCHSPSGGPLLHQVCIYTLYIYILSYSYSCSLYLHPAATTLLDMVQVIQPAVDATVHQWPWPALAGIWWWEFISSYNSTFSIVGVWSLSAAGSLSHCPNTSCSLQPEVFW